MSAPLTLFVCGAAPDGLDLELVGLVETATEPPPGPDDCRHCGEPTGRDADDYAQVCAYCGRDIYDDGGR